MPIIFRLESSITEEFKILEITTQLPDYKLAFYINEITKFALKKINDIDIFNSSNNKLEPYSLFYFKDLYSHEYFLLKKTNQLNSLLPYFLLFIKGIQTDEEFEILQSNILNIDNVLDLRYLHHPRPVGKIKTLNALIREINDISYDFGYIREKTNERIKVYRGYLTNEQKLQKSKF